MAETARRSVLLPVSMILFALGLVAIIAIFSLYAAGHTNLPLWLNISASLCPLGLIVGVVGSFIRTRRDRSQA